MATVPPAVMGTPVDTGYAVAAGTTKTTTAFNAYNGDLLTVRGMTEDSGITLTISDNQGGTLVWTRQQFDATANRGWAAIWTAPVPSDLTGVTVTLTASQASKAFGGRMAIMRGHGGVGVSGKATGGGTAPSVTLALAGRSAVLAEIVDWSAGAASPVTWSSVPGTPTAEIASQQALLATFFQGRWNDTGAAGSKAVGATTVGNSTSIIALEVLGRSVSGGNAEVLADAPNGYWRMGEAAGSVAFDRSDFGVHGIYEGAHTKGVAGIMTGDTAVSFAGGDVVFSGQDIAGTPLYLAQGVVEAWIKTTDTDAGYHAVFVKQNAYGLLVKGGVLITYDYTANADRSSGISVADGQWHHVAQVFDSGVAGGGQLYVDGAPAGAAFTTTVLNQGDATPHIGTDPSVHTFNGTIDEVAVFGSTLSAARILAHYNAGLPVPPAVVLAGVFDPLLIPGGWF